MHDPLWKNRWMNDAHSRHATQSMKSVALSPLSLLYLRLTASVKFATGVPLCVVLATGSAVNLPPRMTLLKLKFAIMMPSCC